MPCIPRAGRTLLLAAATWLLASCDDSTGNSGSIQVSLTSTGISVTQGGAATTGLTITRAGGFAGVVNLTVTGLPPGVGVGFAPAQLSATDVSATINVTVAPTAVAGTFNMTINATGAGVTPATVNLELTISPAPDFRLSMTTSALSITAGQSGNATVNIERMNYAGEIALALVNAPAGITASFSPITISANSTVMTLSVGPAVTPATYPVQVEGVGEGVGARVATLMVTVLPQLASFSINLSPAVLTLPRGNTSVVTITLTRTDYAGPITLAFENPPPGITGTIVPASTTGNTATFTIDVGDNVAPGGYQLRLRGTAPGFIDRVAFLQVSVTVPTGGVVEYLYCNASEVPAFFAYQDGSGPWKQVLPATTGTITRFTFTLVQDRGGVLAVRHTTSPMVADALNNQRGRSLVNARRTRSRVAGTRGARAYPALLVDQYFTDVAYATTPELAQDGIDNCRQTLGTRTVSGSVAGISAPEVGVISLGDATEVFLPGSTANPVTLSGVPEGVSDLIASRMPAAGNAPDRIVVLRGLDVPDGGVIPATIDFTGPNSSLAASATATITGSGSDLLEMYTDLVTSNGRGALWFDLVPSLNTQRPWGGLSSGSMIPGDFHGLAAFATPPAAGPADFRVVLRFTGAVANQSMTMGAVLNTPAATQIVAGAYPRYRFQGSVPADYNKGVSVDIASAAGDGNGYSIIATSAWLAGAGSALAYDLTMPDVSALPGFPPAARLTAGPNDTAVSGFGWTGQGIFDLRPAIGMEFKAASRGVAIVVP
jgi:hypothetical protein